MENIEFEEKVDIDNLVLPSELRKLPEMEILAVKEESFEGSIHEKEKCAASESAHGVYERLLKKIQTLKIPKTHTVSASK